MGWLEKFDRALLWISTAKADLRHRTADRTPLRHYIQSFSAIGPNTVPESSSVPYFLQLRKTTPRNLNSKVFGIRSIAFDSCCSDHVSRKNTHAQHTRNAPFHEHQTVMKLRPLKPHDHACNNRTSSPIKSVPLGAHISILLLRLHRLANLGIQAPTAPSTVTRRRVLTHRVGKQRLSFTPTAPANPLVSVVSSTKPPSNFAQIANLQSKKKRTAE